jgi:predicted ATPase
VLTDLLDMAPTMKILLSNRRPLQIPIEHEFKVVPLSLPDRSDLPPMERLDEYSGIRLFMDRAKTVNPSFCISLENSAAVVEICAQLEGLPLGIELVAARSKAYSPQALWQTLEGYLNFQSPGARHQFERQQTLRATLDWTYDLLAVPEQRVASLAGLFPGGFTLEALAAVGALDQTTLEAVIASLVENSWLQRQSYAAGPLRFALLDTIREYALERLPEHSLTLSVHQRWVAYYLELVERAEPELTGSQQAFWLDQLAAEYVNIRAALRWSIDQRSPASLQLAAGLWRFWLMRGYVSEGRRWMDMALGQNPDAPAEVCAKALNGLGTLASVQGDYPAAKTHFTTSLELQRKLGNIQGAGFALNNLGLVASEQGNYHQAARLLRQSLTVWRSLDDRRQIAITLSNLGVMALEQGDYPEAVGYLEESLTHARSLENAWGIAIALINLGEAMSNQAEIGRASQFLAEGLVLSRQVGDTRLLTSALITLGYVAIAQSQYQPAREALAESLRLCYEGGDKRGLARTLEASAMLLAAQAHTQQAAYLLGAADSLRTTIGTPLPPADSPRYAQLIERIRAVVDPAAFAEAWTAGQIATLDHVLNNVFADSG